MSRENWSEDLCRCHTKRRIGGRGPANPSFGKAPILRHQRSVGQLSTLICKKVSFLGHPILLVWRPVFVWHGSDLHTFINSLLLRSSWVRITCSWHMDKSHIPLVTIITAFISFAHRHYHLTKMYGNLVYICGTEYFYNFEILYIFHITTLP